MDLILNINVTLTEIAAWWGAIMATVVFLWDIIKWLHLGPRVQMDSSTNMEFIGDSAKKGKKFVTVKVTNNGTQATTLINLGMFYYTNWFNRLINRQNKSMIVMSPGASYPIPHALEPGKVWDGIIDQNEEIEKMGEEGVLEAVLFCSHSKALVKSRITFKHNDAN